MIIGVVGLPGSGKSTMMRHLAALQPDVACWYEDPQDYPLVDHVGRDAPSGHVLNQVSFQIRKIELAFRVAQAPALDHVIEMDWMSSHRLWCEGLAAADMITAADVAVLERLHAAAIQVGTPQSDLYVHIVGPVDLLVERLLVRGRHFELSEDFVRLMTGLGRVVLADELGPTVRIPHDVPAQDAARSVLAEIERRRR